MLPLTGGVATKGAGVCALVFVRSRFVNTVRRVYNTAPRRAPVVSLLVQLTPLDGKD